MALHTIVMVLMSLNILPEDEGAMSVEVDALLGNHLSWGDDIRDFVKGWDGILERRFRMDKVYYDGVG